MVGWAICGNQLHLRHLDGLKTHYFVWLQWQPPKYARLIVKHCVGPEKISRLIVFPWQEIPISTSFDYPGNDGSPFDPVLGDKIVL